MVELVDCARTRLTGWLDRATPGVINAAAQGTKQLTVKIV